MWYTLAIVLIIVVSILLILIVLVQNPKGGGFASGFSGMNQFGGVAQTNKFLERTTWTFAVIILFLSLMATVAAKSYKHIEYQQQTEEFITDYDFETAPMTPVNIQPPEEQQNQQPPQTPTTPNNQ